MQAADAAPGARRAREGAGRFVLAKIDIDANPELAQAFRVQSIPSVLALVGGKLADGFQGALPEPELDTFLARIAPAGTPPGEQLLEEARTLVEAGEAQQAVSILRDHLRSEPTDERARLFLADVLIDSDKAAEARLVFAKLSEEMRDSAAGKALLARLEFAESDTDLGPLQAAVEASPKDAAARLALGQALIAAKRHEEGLEELLETLRLDPGGVGVQAKAAMLEVFDVLGMEDPLANDYRFKLSLELFA